mmetsp:Transcript_48083/g.120207  ORF Transcript_48083/g.120207 Transcript_48083/m.120207 type:complete len:104 (+) Transcript_48083:152-463(+)
MGGSVGEERSGSPPPTTPEAMRTDAVKRAAAVATLERFFDSCVRYRSSWLMGKTMREMVQSAQSVMDEQINAGYDITNMKAMPGTCDIICYFFARLRAESYSL